MPNEMSKFTVRIDSDLLRKFKIVADYNARSANSEIKIIIKNHLAEFEKKHGKIDPE